MSPCVFTFDKKNVVFEMFIFRHDSTAARVREFGKTLAIRHKKERETNRTQVMFLGSLCTKAICTDGFLLSLCCFLDIHVHV